MFHLAGDEDVLVARYLEKIILKLQLKAGIIEQQSDHDMNGDANISFEEILFLRIAYEYTKMYKSEISNDYNDYLEKIALSFDDYSKIFTCLLLDEHNRLLFSEWVKFSL